ncbi:hypothetical protein KC341_g94 [Hortaea werneckii]|nr:hypothetical protein KC341_g94 [Hortaea werneckii]
MNWVTESLSSLTPSEHDNAVGAGLPCLPIRPSLDLATELALDGGRLKLLPLTEGRETSVLARGENCGGPGWGGRFIAIYGGCWCRRSLHWLRYACDGAVVASGGGPAKEKGYSSRERVSGLVSAAVCSARVQPPRLVAGPPDVCDAAVMTVFSVWDDKQEEHQSDASLSGPSSQGSPLAPGIDRPLEISRSASKQPGKLEAAGFLSSARLLDVGDNVSLFASPPYGSCRHAQAIGTAIGCLCTFDYSTLGYSSKRKTLGPPRRMRITRNSEANVRSFSNMPSIMQRTVPSSPPPMHSISDNHGKKSSTSSRPTALTSSSVSLPI